MARSQLSYLRVRVTQDCDTRFSERLLQAFWQGGNTRKKAWMKLKAMGVTKLWRAKL